MLTRKKLPKKPKTRARRRMPLYKGMPPSALEYRNLLLDPCSAKMVGPVGSSIGTGLFARYREFVVPTIAADTNSISAICKLDFDSHAIGLGVASDFGNTFATSFKSTSVGVLDSTVARGYRIIAACIKWVPTGPILYRSGVVRSLVSRENIPIQLANMSQIAPLCMHTATNGSEPHEVVYFPSDADLDFSTTSDVSNANTGSTIALCVDDIDCSYVTLPTAEATARGYFDVTWVAEWIPANGTAMTTTIVPPTPVTLGQLYDTIKPFAAIAGNALARSAYMKAMGYITQAAVARLTG